MTLGRRLTVLLLTLTTALVLATPGSAFATTGHTFAGQFGGLGDGDGQFGEGPGNGPAGIAVNPSTGDVFTTDTRGLSGVAAPRVQRFSADGSFLSTFAVDSQYGSLSSIAVDPSGGGSVYIPAVRVDGVSFVLKYSAAGTFDYTLNWSTSGTSVNGFSSPPVAVDPVDGTVYVPATDDGTGLPVIDSFDATTGAFITDFDGSSGAGSAFLCAPTSLAVDGAHRVYVLNPCKNRVDQYNADGSFGATVDDGTRGTPSNVAADTNSNEVYVSEAGPVGLQMTHFTAGGAAPIYTFDASNVAGLRGLAASSTGTVYTSDATNPFVERFTPFDGPTVETGSVMSSDARSATLEGTINPQGISSSYHFEYGTRLTYGSRTDDVDAGSGSGAGPASTLVTGLSPATTYNYRIVGSNVSGSIVGTNQTFTTAAAPPTLDVVAPFVSQITPRGVQLHGSVNPNNAFFTSYSFEYGPTAAYGSSTTAGFFVNSGGKDLPVTAQLSDLQPETLYHFRVVADNGTPPAQQGQDQTFITSSAAGSGASSVTSRRASLTGIINAHGQATTFHFNVGQTTAYGVSTPEASGGDGDGDEPVSQPISGLLPDTTYHVQVVATTGDVTRFGGDGLFTTAPAPHAVAISPVGITTSTATLSGSVDTYGLSGAYRFTVSSLDGSYSTTTADQPVSGNASAQRVSVPITGLPPGQTFSVQLSLTSNDSTDVSDLVTFATPAVPRVYPAPPPGAASSYGCASPYLDAYNAKPKPGDTITIGGHDLGAGGTAVVDDRSWVPIDWSTSGFKLQIPSDASGTLALTVNCGRRSNTIAIAIFQQPDSHFSITKTTVKASTATLSVKLPGPGKLATASSRTRPASATVKNAGTAKVTVKLSPAGARALRKAKNNRLKVALRVRFTPAGGTSALKTVSLTFKHSTGR